MKATVLSFAALMLPLLAHQPIQAQSQAQSQTQTQDVWRCGSDGRSYSTTPCSEGRVVATTDARPAADVLAAQQLAQREARLAEQLRLEHRQEDARRVGSGYGLLSAPRQAAATVTPQTAQTVVKTRRTVHRRSAAAGTSPAVVQASRRTTG